jgi:hypothetical protein
MNESFSKVYLKALLAGFGSLTQDLPAIVDAADRVAGRLLAGGRLLLASVRSDFTSEGYIRGGGLMLLEEWTPTMSLSPDDTVIFGWSDTGQEQELELLLLLRASGALIIGIGPAHPTWTGVDALPSADLLSASWTPPAGATKAFGGEAYPLTSLQNLVILWMLTGEIVSALSRSGQMPTMYQSVLVDGARERNARIGASRFHETHDVAAIPSGQLGTSYLKAISGIIEALVDEETVSIDGAAKLCAKVLQGGGVVYAGMISHFPMHQHGAPGDPMHMQRLQPLDAESPSVPELKTKLQQGDLFFFLGYYRRPATAYRVAHEAGAFIVEVITGDGCGDGNGPQPDHVIRPRWPFGDALISVPGYDVEILPGSGIVQAAIYWAVVGQIAQTLAQQPTNLQKANRPE